MKKLLVMGVLGLSLALITEDKASAWVNAKFGVGLNWSWQSGGNNFLWGAFRNGQPPGPDVAYPGQHPGFQQAPFNPQHYGPQDFQYFGGAQPRNGNPAAQPAPTAPTAQQNVSWYGSSLYQPVSYSPANYPNSMYNYPTQSYYGSYQVPSYWYGR
jgi:hypothetical protein